MDRSAFASWLEHYEAAWRSNDGAAIGDLFTDDAVYRWHPYDDGDSLARGRDEIVRAWLAEPDDPGSWTLTCEPLAVDADVGVARCVTRYSEPERTYHNIFVVRLDDSNRCFDFTEYYMLEPRPTE